MKVRHLTHSKLVCAVPEGGATFPALYQFLGGYFHQDFDIFGETLEEIMAACREELSPKELKAVATEIHRFIATYGVTLEKLNAALQTLFKPQVIIDGWDGMNSKQWLQRVAELALQDQTGDAVV